jgi:F-type H+-transporting ATPase subunit gamma
MAAMAAAHRQIEQQLQKLELTRHLVRQEEITAEVIELAAGANTASRERPPRMAD